MKTLRVLGILILLAGIASLMTSNYITGQVEEGKGQIKAGEQKVKQGQQLFSGNPVGQQIGQGLMGGANKKIAQGKEQIAYYEHLAETLNTAGIVALVVGGGLFLFSFTMKKKKR
jgi:hypothetical protein